MILFGVNIYVRVAKNRSISRSSRDLNDFKLGDYIDKANKDYFYYFTYECPHCHEETNLSIGIRKGQYVGVYLARDTEKKDPKELENIEDGYQRKREYEEMCSRKLGYEETEEWAEKLIALKVGDRLFALQTEWEVLEVYLEELKPEIEEKEFMRILYHPTVVYRCRANNEDVYRLIRSEINPFTGTHYYVVLEDRFDQLPWREKIKKENRNRYSIQEGCVLKSIDGGTVVWERKKYICK